MRTGKHFLIPLIVLFFSCSKDSDPGQDAWPKCLVTTYHDTNRIETVTVDRNSDGNAVKMGADVYDYNDELFYDASKRLISEKRTTPPSNVNIIDITYDGSGRIQSTTMYQEDIRILQPRRILLMMLLESWLQKNIFNLGFLKTQHALNTAARTSELYTLKRTCYGRINRGRESKL